MEGNSSRTQDKNDGQDKANDIERKIKDDLKNKDDDVSEEEAESALKGTEPKPKEENK